MKILADATLLVPQSAVGFSIVSRHAIAGRVHKTPIEIISIAVVGIGRMGFGNLRNLVVYYWCLAPPELQKMRFA